MSLLENVTTTQMVHATEGFNKSFPLMGDKILADCTERNQWAVQVPNTGVQKLVEQHFSENGFTVSSVVYSDKVLCFVSCGRVWHDHEIEPDWVLTTSGDIAA